MQKTLVKIYDNKAVFLSKTNRLTVENISPDALKVLDFYKKIPVNKF